MPDMGDIQITTEKKMVEGIRKEITKIMQLVPVVEHGQYVFENGKHVCHWVEAKCSVAGCNSLAEHVDEDSEQFCKGCFQELEEIKAEHEIEKELKKYQHLG